MQLISKISTFSGILSYVFCLTYFVLGIVSFLVCNLSYLLGVLSYVLGITVYFLCPKYRIALRPIP